MITGRKYRINPTCPFCKEEHEYWDILLTEEEQRKMDDHVEKNKGCSSLFSLLSPPAIRVSRRLKCICGNEFEADVGLWPEDEVGRPNPDLLEIGNVPLIEKNDPDVSDDFKKGKIITLVQLVQKDMLKLDVAASVAGVSEEEFSRYLTMPEYAD